MAGRPKKMAERATELDLLAFALSVEVFASAPPQYRQGDSDPKDAIGALWKRCVSDAIRLSLQIEALAILLRRKAGLPPIPELDADDDTEEGDAGGEEPAERVSEAGSEESTPERPESPEEPVIGEGLFEQVFQQARTLKIARQIAKN